MDASRRWARPASCREEVGCDPVSGLAGGRPWFFRNRPPAPIPSADERLIPAPFRRVDCFQVHAPIQVWPVPVRLLHFTSRCLLPASLQRLAISFPSVWVDMWLSVRPRPRCHPGAWPPPPIVLHGRPPTTSKNPDRAAKKPAAALYPALRVSRSRFDHTVDDAKFSP